MAAIDWGANKLGQPNRVVSQAINRDFLEKMPLTVTNPTIFTYEKNNQAELDNSWIDKLKAATSNVTDSALDATKLSVIKKYIPENAVSFITNKTWTQNIPLKEQLSLLPKLPDGSYDTNKIKEALKIAEKEILKKNDNAKELINYGLHRKNINGLDTWLLAFPPEIAHILEKTGAISEHRIETFGLVNKTLSRFSDNSEYQAINNEINPKDSMTIEKNISFQNKEIKKLSELPLNSEADIQRFLKEYQKVTGTSFSCEDIIQASKILSDHKTTNEDKAKVYVKNFGFPENYIDAHKNKAVTDVVYNIGLKYGLPKALSFVPTGAFWAPGMPFGIELGESLTKGVEDNQIINRNNITLKEVLRIHVDGAVHGAMVLFPAWGRATRMGIRGANSFMNKILSD